MPMGALSSHWSRSTGQHLSDGPARAGAIWATPLIVQTRRKVDEFGARFVAAAQAAEASVGDSPGPVLPLRAPPRSARDGAGSVRAAWLNAPSRTSAARGRTNTSVRRRSCARRPIGRPRTRAPGPPPYRAAPGARVRVVHDLPAVGGDVEISLLMVCQPRKMVVECQSSAWRSGWCSGRPGNLIWVLSRA